MCQDCEYPGQLARDEPDDYGPTVTPGPDPWDYRPTAARTVSATGCGPCEAPERPRHFLTNTPFLTRRN